MALCETWTLVGMSSSIASSQVVGHRGSAAAGRCLFNALLDLTLRHKNARDHFKKTYLVATRKNLPGMKGSR
jgi:hypothetical protein